MKSGLRRDTNKDGPMKLDDLTDIITRSFDQHVDGLEVAARSHGVTVLSNENLRNTDVVMMVSPAAYAALMKRADKPSS